MLNLVVDLDIAKAADINNFSYNQSLQVKIIN